MASLYGQQNDPDFKDWLRRIMIAGEVPSQNIITAVGMFVVTCKQNDIWDKLKEVYILSGLTNFEATKQKLKYINNPLMLSSGISSSHYTPTGPGAGVDLNNGNMSYNLDVSMTDLELGNRSAGVYDIAKVDSFYSTLIGRQRGGSNSAWGPTVDPTGITAWRFLDLDSGTVGIGSSNTSPAGLFANFEGVGEVFGYAHNSATGFSYPVQGVMGGTGGYTIGAPLGGGGWGAATIRFGYLGLSFAA